MFDVFRFIVLEDTKCAVAVDNVRGHIYWSDYDLYTITRAALDGSNQEVIATGGKFFKGTTLFRVYCTVILHSINYHLL